MHRRKALLSIAATVATTSWRASATTARDSAEAAHIQWVARVLEKMESIKPGMTRADLLDVFTTEGGLSTRTQQTYVSQDCPYFKVDVTFLTRGTTGKDVQGRETMPGDGRDQIVSMSQPYLQFSVMD